MAIAQSVIDRWAKRVRTAARNPGYAARRLTLLAYELTHPGEPWIASGAVRYCERYLPRTARGLEWGSGRSTLWFAARLEFLTSVEHDRDWFKRMDQQVRTLGNVDYRHIELEHSATQPTFRSYDPQPKYVAVAQDFEDESLGLVVVDGHYRQACVRAAAPKIKRGGLLLIDNWNRMDREEWGVPADFELVHMSSNAMTQTAIWSKP